MSICIECSYAPSADAFSKGVCAICGKEMHCRKTPPHKVCKDCAEKLNLCQSCGKPLPKQRMPDV